VKSNAYGDPFPNEQMTIGLIGSHCTGKTTAGQLLSAWTGFPLLAEGVRDIVHLMGYQQIADVPDQALMQWNIMRHQINQEESIVRLQEVQGAPTIAYITDRTTLDNAAYFQMYQFGKISQAEFDAYTGKAFDHAQLAYSHFIYFPILWDEIEDDGFRDTAPGPRREIDDMIRGQLTALNLWDRTFTVGAGSTAQRCTAIMEHLNLWPRMRELAHTLKPHREIPTS
jgi:hypothetical protein